jgi:hypothetical protein
MWRALIALSVLALILPVVVSAESRNNQIQDPTQVRLQDQDEDRKMEIDDSEKLQEDRIDDEEDIENEEEVEDSKDGERLDEDKTKSVSSRSDIAKERMSVVAQKAEELLTTQEAAGGIGEQISQVAREQKEAQEEIEKEVESLEARSVWLERLIGPNYKAVKNLKQQVERNKLRIQQLEQLQGQLIDEADRNRIQEAIQAISELNNVLEDQIRIKEQVGSIFGWLFRLLAR